MTGAFVSRPRSLRVQVGVAALLSIAIGASVAADMAASAAPATPSQRLQQRFTAAVEGWRKSVLNLPDPNPRLYEAQLVRELRVVIAPTPAPLLRVQRRLDGHTIVISAGWLALLDELLRAEAVLKQESVAEGASAPAVNGAQAGSDCFGGYAQSVWGVLADNRCRAAGMSPGPLQAWPRLVSWVESKDAPKGCANLKRISLQRLGVQARVEDGADTVALWLLTRQAARLIAMPVPVPSAASAPEKAAASAADNELSLRLPRSTLHCPATSRSTASAVARLERSSWVADPADQRALKALMDYGLAQPRALLWLRENAALFDAETAVKSLPR